MKNLTSLAFALTVFLAAPPALAQDDQNGGDSLMERGMELFFDGLRDEMAPAMDNLRGMAEQFGPAMAQFWSEMGPAFSDVLDEVKDWTQYHAPEILPNGDIIMRKRVDPEIAPPPTPVAPEGQTDI